MKRFRPHARGRGDPDAANSGKIGDGKILVYELEQVMRIRTGELDGDAL
jgi:nitrogen regulatory protein PII